EEVQDVVAGREAGGAAVRHGRVEDAVDARRQAEGGVGVVAGARDGEVVVAGRQARVEDGVAEQRRRAVGRLEPVEGVVVQRQQLVSAGGRVELEEAQRGVERRADAAGERLRGQ